MPRNIQTASLLLAFQQDLESLLQVTPSSILVFDLEGKILGANDAAADLLKESVDALAGKNIFELFKLDDPPFEAQVLQLAETHDVFSFEGLFRGRTIFCFLYPIANERGSILRVGLIAQDNTDRRRAEEQVRILTQELELKVRERTAALQAANTKLNDEKKRAELLANFSRILVEYVNDYAGLLQHISDEIAQLVADACIIGIFSEGGAELQVSSISHRSDHTLQEMRAAIQKKSYPLEQVGLASLIWQGGNYVGAGLTFEQARQLVIPDLAAALPKEGLKGLVGIPLVVHDRVLGGIFVARNDPEAQPYGQEDIAFLETIAGPLALTIENARLFDEIKQNRQELRGLSQQLVKLQEDQFQHLGRELHDHVGQDLTAININLTLIEDMLPDDAPQALLVRLADANRLVEESVSRMRNIMADFLPPMLDRYGLNSALLWYSEKFSQRTEIKVTVSDYNLHDVRLQPDVEISLFRIAQEALNNIAKHAHARAVEIELKDAGGRIVMTVADDGVGFDPRAAPVGREDHWGLAIMRERARAVDASFEIKSAAGEGTRIIVSASRKS
jgi:PAS domain S-box-containing protein